MVTAADLRVVSERQPTEQELRDALFCWKVAKFVKSNAIVYARDNMTIGIGAGQMSRVYSAKIAGIKASDEGLEVKGSAMASDAFFPFRDGIDAAAAVGITCVIQPGGSIRDDEVIAAANEHGIAMILPTCVTSAINFAACAPAHAIRGAPDEHFDYRQRRARARAGLESRPVSAGG